MQSHLPGPSLTSNQIINTSDNDLKSNTIKSPLKSNFIKKRLNKNTSDIENMEPNHAKLLASTDQNSNNNLNENKPSSTTPGKPRLETNIPEIPINIINNPPPAKPAESPFTAFCKGLYLSPGPMINNNASPLFFPKTNLFFGSSNDVNNIMSPVVPFKMDNGLNSPTFSREAGQKLDFPNRFNMKSGKDDINIEHEDTPGKDAGNIDDEVFQTPSFNFSVNKSVYGNTRLVPTQSRKNDIYSQSPTTSKHELDDKEEAHSISQLQKSDKEPLEAENITDLHGMMSELRTPSPSKKLAEGQKNIENLQIQRDISFGTATAAQEYNAGNSSSRSSTNKMKIETEEEEGEGENENEENSSSLKASGTTSSKKKICCNCKKSRCLKLYCDCFARGKGCTKECNCQNCLNNESNVEERKVAMQNTLERNPIAFKPKVNQLEGAVEEQAMTEIKDGKARHIKGCNCKKSGCLKKYCECFQAGVKCSDVCKCENCKNMEGDPNSKKPHSHGACAHTTPGLESHEKSGLRLHSPQSEMTEHTGMKSGVRNYQALEHEREEEDEGIFEENEGNEGGKKFFNPRKQLFTNLKSPMVAGGPKTPMSFRLKADEVLGEHAEDGDGEKHKSGAKKERKRKVSTVSTAPPKTPTNMIDLKKGFDYTPSPEKQSLSGGRARRNIRPLTHLNPDEYEMGK